MDLVPSTSSGVFGSGISEGAARAWRGSSDIYTGSGGIHVVENDCDSDGEEPPDTEEFIHPDLISEEQTVAAVTSGTSRALRTTITDKELPFYKPAPRPRMRKAFEPAVPYETWVASTPGNATQLALASLSGNETSGGAAVPTMGGFSSGPSGKLEDDSDLPIGQPYFWKPYCHDCGKGTYPHIPPRWECPTCDKKMSMQMSDRESKYCAICRRKNAKELISVGAKKLRNPLALNAHSCKRCGLIVCDNCYAHTAQDVSEYGYTEPQKVCTRCLQNVMELSLPPEEGDYGTLYEEGAALALEDDSLLLPYCMPKCTTCNVQFPRPPPHWLCPTCQKPVWQPTTSVESSHCFICSEPKPDIHCTRCGQLGCCKCCVYMEPVPDRGFTDGCGVVVCRLCYSGITMKVASRRAIAEKDDKVLKYLDALQKQVDLQVFRGSCPQCEASFETPPPQWISKCHNRKVWMTSQDPRGGICCVCEARITDGARERCFRCGKFACRPCSQYKEPVPDRGYPTDISHTVCMVCHNPEKLSDPHYTSFPYWPPKCLVCSTAYKTPPDQWRCVKGCGVVWQPRTNIASRSCWTCGIRMETGVNCRKCGRLVCGECGKHRLEVTERGYTRGMPVPVCSGCVPKPESKPEAGAEQSSNGRKKTPAQTTRKGSPTPKPKKAAPSISSSMAGGGKGGSALATRSSPPRQGGAGVMIGRDDLPPGGAKVPPVRGDGKKQMGRPVTPPGGKKVQLGGRKGTTEQPFQE